MKNVVLHFSVERNHGKITFLKAACVAAITTFSSLVQNTQNIFFPSKNIKKFWPIWLYMYTVTFVSETSKLRGYNVNLWTKLAWGFLSFFVNTEWCKLLMWFCSVVLGKVLPKYFLTLVISALDEWTALRTTLSNRDHEFTAQACALALCTLKSLQMVWID